MMILKWMKEIGCNDVNWTQNRVVFLGGGHDDKARCPHQQGIS